MNIRQFETSEHQIKLSRAANWVQWSLTANDTIRKLVRSSNENDLKCVMENDYVMLLKTKN